MNDVNKTVYMAGAVQVCIGDILLFVLVLLENKAFAEICSYHIQFTLSDGEYYLVSYRIVHCDLKSQGII